MKLFPKVVFIVAGSALVLIIGLVTFVMVMYARLEQDRNKYMTATARARRWNGEQPQPKTDETVNNTEMGSGSGLNGADRDNGLERIPGDQGTQSQEGTPQ